MRAATCGCRSVVETICESSRGSCTRAGVVLDEFFLDRIGSEQPILSRMVHSDTCHVNLCPRLVPLKLYFYGVPNAHLMPRAKLEIPSCISTSSCLG